MDHLTSFYISSCTRQKCDACKQQHLWSQSASVYLRFLSSILYRFSGKLTLWNGPAKFSSAVDWLPCRGTCGTETRWCSGKGSTDTSVVCDTTNSEQLQSFFGQQTLLYTATRHVFYILVFEPSQLRNSPRKFAFQSRSAVLTQTCCL